MLLHPPVDGTALRGVLGQTRRLNSDRPLDESGRDLTGGGLLVRGHEEKLQEIEEKLGSFDKIIFASGMYAFGVSELLQVIEPYLEDGIKYYPDDMYTDMSTYRIITEIVREKILLKTRDEIPHSVAVEIIDVERKEGQKDKFNINIYVERDSQKGIVIGKNGKMLKDIGVEARKEIEELLGKKIYLGLWVKVKDEWRKKKPFLKEMGYVEEK